VVTLFENRPRARRLGSAGRERMACDYSWALAGERQEELYRRVLRGADGHGQRAHITGVATRTAGDA